MIESNATNSWSVYVAKDKENFYTSLNQRKWANSNNDKSDKSTTLIKQRQAYTTGSAVSKSHFVYLNIVQHYKEKIWVPGAMRPRDLCVSTEIVTFWLSLAKKWKRWNVPSVTRCCASTALKVWIHSCLTSLIAWTAWNSDKLYQ